MKYEYVQKSFITLAQSKDSLKIKTLRWRHDIQHNNTQHIELTCETQHK
jgi:hypothetical protein